MFRKNIFILLFTLFLSLSLNVYAESSTQALFHQANDPIAGNPNGKITVVEFFDYQCSHCVNMAPVIQAIIQSNSDVRIVFKEFPIRGPISEFAARAALAANMQGKYAAFNHALLTTTQFLSEESILKIAKSEGLDVNRLKKDMNSNQVNNQLRNNYNLAQSLGLNGTPAFFIGPTYPKSDKDVNYALGEMSKAELQNAINNAKQAVS